jgi:hypothetical protein
MLLRLPADCLEIARQPRKLMSRQEDNARGAAIHSYKPDSV